MNSIIPGESPTYQKSDVIVIANPTQSDFYEVIVPGTLLLDMSAEYGMLAGTVLGRITATGYLTRCNSSATDGSQIPYGLLKNNFQNLANLSAGDVSPVSVVVAGRTKSDGWTESHIDSSWGTTLTSRVAAIVPLLKMVGIFRGENALYSAVGKTSPGGGLTGNTDVADLVEIRFLATIDQGNTTLVSVFDGHTGSMIGFNAGTAWLFNKRTAAHLVGIGVAAYV